MDEDKSRTLDTHECQSYLAEIGYLDEEIDNFFTVCDRDSDGSITWNEFLLGAAALYKPKAKAISAQLGAVAAALHVTPEGSSSKMQVHVDSGMSWSDVIAATLRVMQESLAPASLSASGDLAPCPAKAGVNASGQALICDLPYFTCRREGADILRVHECPTRTRTRAKGSPHF